MLAVPEGSVSDMLIRNQPPYFSVLILGTQVEGGSAAECVIRTGVCQEKGWDLCHLWAVEVRNRRSGLHVVRSLAQPPKIPFDGVSHQLEEQLTRLLT